MDQRKKLAELIQRTSGAGRQIAVYQGIVKSVEGLTCTCTFGSVDVSGIRLRASESEDDSQLLLTPAVGSAVTVGSLSGDLSQLVVIQVDRVQSITINGGKLGGLVNIGALTDKLNELVKAFNSHTHQVTTSGTATSQTGTAAAPLSKASSLNRSDYEDTTINH